MKCKKGKKLLHEWTVRVQNAPTPDIAYYIMFSPRDYDKHAKRCKTCGKGKK